jgi:hypothetical protein
MLLAKIIAILILIWFYQGATEQQQNPFKWIIVGLIGYWLTYWIVDLGVTDPLVKSMTNGPRLLIGVLRHVPEFAGVVVAFFVRKKLVSDAQRAQP